MTKPRKHGARLKPCPFCGSRPEEFVSHSEQIYWVQCIDSHCFVNPSTNDCATAKAACMAWNMRFDRPRATPKVKRKPK